MMVPPPDKTFPRERVLLLNKTVPWEMVPGLREKMVARQDKTVPQEMIPPMVKTVPPSGKKLPRNMVPGLPEKISLLHGQKWF